MASFQNLLVALVHLWMLAGHANGFSSNPLARSVRSKASLSASFPSEPTKSGRFNALSMQLSKTLTSIASAAIIASSVIAPVLPVNAIESQIIGQISGSGLIFKDTLEIERFEDPKIKGVTLYITNFQRPITERLTSNFLQDPSYASVACVKSSPTVAVADNINMTPQGEEVFQESKSLLFKTLRVQRVYDAEKKTAIYVSFNTRLDKNDDTNKSRFKSSVCAVNLE